MMRNDVFIAPFVAAVFGLVIMLITAFAGGFDDHPYEACQEDEVWAWQAGYSPDYPNKIEWECVAIDDLG